jgi:hypothetical protein
VQGSSVMQQKPESFTDEDVKIRNSNMPPSCIHHVFFTNHELSFFFAGNTNHELNSLDLGKNWCATEIK